MRSNQLLLIVPVYHPQAAKSVEKAIHIVTDRLDADIQMASIEEVLNDESKLDDARMAWIILDPNHSETEQNRFVPDLAFLCEERHLPALISRSASHAPHAPHPPHPPHISPPPHDTNDTNATHDTNGVNNTVTNTTTNDNVDNPTPQPTHRPGDALTGSLIAVPNDTDADPHTIAAVAATAWNLAASLADMQNEADIQRQHQRGLCSQIDHLDEEMRLAAKLQHEMLPKRLPEIPGYDLEAFYRPATYVSGDIYDVFMLDDDHLGFFIADATGHGVSAAMMTVYIKRSFQTRFIDPNEKNGYRILTPAETLTQLNYDMTRLNTVNVRFCTAAYGILNIKTRELKTARAGHPFPFLLRKDGPSQTIAPEGPLLGVFPDADFEIATHTLAAGDRVLLYSDGFEMAFDGETDKATGKTPVANERYAEEFKDLATGSLPDAIDRLTKKLDSQSGSLHQRDDLTVVLIGLQADADALDPAAVKHQGKPVTRVSRRSSAA